jgi:hypothetical protein
LAGLAGILATPLLRSDFDHLLANFHPCWY